MNLEQLVGAGTLWAAIPIALIAGLLSFLSPCVLPLVPGYLGYISGAVLPKEKQGELAPRGRLVVGVLLFIAGFTVVFMAMNIFSGGLGVFFLKYNDIITRILGVVIILMGLVFLGLFGFAQRQAKLSLNSNLGLAGAPLLGFALGLGWAPCIGPTLAVIMSLSWNTGNVWRAALLGLVYSLGLGIPFLLVAFGLGWATKSLTFMRRHVRTINIIGGSLLILIGALMVSGIWGVIMNRMQGVIGSVNLPI
ncbi:cytochrome C biogenesis protein CcdA [Microbacterium sorbitolivorans]|uniref:Cytochrome c biogenesis protein CcdA n=1 Tax=Microbacterium sorbitolivorans TaxID=1867410 RepID=A0A367XZ49_9MICO|nr:cytochrome c biogenesis protein CcdA [Microbacterium sorbitolivorans]RCK58550.1 cytochrome c biogenesis protein CcdA [Microbacterium sorbitolivorans]GGF37442.1 cytochrome C biogenesis protein CcdA [Microbacterium sorbitolivorans]